MEIEVKQAVALEDGKYSGIVVAIEYRETPYKYTDIKIREPVSGMELKYGCPTSGSTNSKLIKLLSKFADIRPGQKINPEKILVGKDVTFSVIQEERDGVTYNRVVDNSVKPKVMTEQVV